MKYSEDLTIDKNNLDGEWLNQPKLVLKYGTALAQQERVVKKLEEKLKTLRSELINRATSEPDKHLGKGIKPTGATIEAYYRTHKEYKKQKKEVHDEELERDLIQVAYSAIQHRRGALDNLVRLHGQGYFSEPKGTDGAKAAQKDLKKRQEKPRRKHAGNK